MIKLLPIDKIDNDILEALKSPLEKVFGQSTLIGNRMTLPGESWNERRGQHLASMLLALIPFSRPGDRALGIVDVDIFAPGLNFVFGQADVAGRRAIISLWRLRQAYYGLPQDDNLFRERALKEAVHEIGHTYGLGHCRNRSCVMHFSNTLSDTDLKEWKFCPVCQQKVSQELQPGAL